MSRQNTLETAMKRLEEIACLLESEISIDESIKLYAEAVKLTHFANEKLDAAKLKIQSLTVEPKEKKDE